MVSHAELTASQLRDPSHHDMTGLPERTSSHHSNDARQQFESLFDQVNGICPSFIDHCFGQDQNVGRDSHVSGHFGTFLLQMSQPGPLRDTLDLAIVDDIASDDGGSNKEPNAQLKWFMDMEARLDVIYNKNKGRFPTQIWNCCTQLCFSRIAADPVQDMLFEELATIHEHAENFHRNANVIPSLPERRRPGIGTSTVSFVAPSRTEREAASGEYHGTEREQALYHFGKFVVEVLPFLYGQKASPSGNGRPKKLCTQAICSLLGVSRNFLYNRRSIGSLETGSADEVREAATLSVIDTAGVRLRQLRRMGQRGNYPSIESLPTYDCGCDTPCFASMEQWILRLECKAFGKLARQLRPRHKENCFLLNRMFCPLTNSTTRVCNRAISALYTVSESLVSDVRRVLDVMCNDSSLEDRPMLTDGSSRYSYDRSHPMNRYPNEVRDKVENHLDMVLRADPAGSSGESVCRVYSPEINTQEKLREVLGRALSAEDSTEADLSSSTLQRMVQDYLKRRNYSTVSFAQSDHNACPNCKTLQYAVLQFHYELLYLSREFDELSGRRPLLALDQRRYDDLNDEIAAKRFQEEECVTELNVHNARDGRIRSYVKRLSDHFRNVESKYQSLYFNARNDREVFEHIEWNRFGDRACITHQDDMSKVDLPHFVVSASSDITRWRFDVNAHVSSINSDAIILSHEQGTGPKNASAIVEEILLNHLLRCRGECIKVIVSDNAAVGKNWLTTIALPQYVVDQGLADICLIVFLENNHGKWLCDMLFGQFQSRRRRASLFSVDDMLNGFEDVKRKSGKILGFAINPLSSVNFSEVFASLGYETKPPSDFGFVKRNIHFSAACAAGAKQNLSGELKELLKDALPDDLGMVRVSTEPPTGTPYCERRYDECYFDAPAARVANTRSGAFSIAVDSVANSYQEPPYDPLVVRLYTPFSPSGNGVVASRTAEKVGYNGLAFRRLNACPEMKGTSTPLVRRAWPRGLLERSVALPRSEEPVTAGESVKCAPLNWIVRRTVKHFCKSDEDWIARYPPRNLLNARYRNGPRCPDAPNAGKWVPTATYREPPFPITEGTAACSAMKRFAAENSDIEQSLHVLDVLRAVFREMGDRDGVSDPWLQRRVTVPCREALARYKEELRVYGERESGHPTAPKTLRQVFKADEQIVVKANEVVQRSTLSGQAAKTLKTKTLNNLFEEAENTPGALDRFYGLVEKDQARYARELIEFKKKQEQFDKDHGLFPRQEIQ